MQTNSAKQILRSTALFGALNEVELQSLAGRAGVRSFDAGEILFSEGEPCIGMYIVVSGRVRIFKTSVNGREQTLSVEGPGASIAELPVFDGGRYPATAAAVERSALLLVGRDSLRALCLEHPEIGLKLLQVVGARLRRLVGIIEELSFTTVRHRLIGWLLRHSPADGGTFALDGSHQELAAQIGTVRELVSRNMARLQAEGLIAVNGREIRILNRSGLEGELL